MILIYISVICPLKLYSHFWYHFVYLYLVSVLYILYIYLVLYLFMVYMYVLTLSIDFTGIVKRLVYVLHKFLALYKSLFIIIIE